MEHYNVYDKKYQSIITRLIKKKNEILITVRYPYQIGNKDLFVINSIESFKNFISERESKDLIVIDNSIKKVTQGIVTEDFIKKIIGEIKIQEKEDLVAIFPKFNGNLDYWNDSIENQQELEEYLKLNIGHYVFIHKEPHELIQDQMIVAYIPDADGKIRPGIY